MRPYLSLSRSLGTGVLPLTQYTPVLPGSNQVDMYRVVISDKTKCTVNVTRGVRVMLCSVRGKEKGKKTKNKNKKNIWITITVLHEMKSKNCLPFSSVMLGYGLGVSGTCSPSAFLIWLDRGSVTQNDLRGRNENQFPTNKFWLEKVKNWVQLSEGLEMLLLLVSWVQSLVGV